MYHIVKGKRSAPNNRKTQMQYLKNSKVVWEKMKGKKYAGNAADRGFYKFNIVCYDEEGMNEIEYLYNNYVKPQLTDKQEIRMTRGLSRITLAIVYRNEISEKIFGNIFYVLSNWAIVAKRKIIGTIELNMQSWGKDEWFDAEYQLRCLVDQR